MIKGQIYLIGSLRNAAIPILGERLRKDGFKIFDEWYSAGEEADDKLRDYFRNRGFSYKEALSSHAAKNIFHFDKRHLDASEAAILVMPAGKSAHLEVGWMAKDKPTFYYIEEEPDRYDLMVQFCTAVCIGYDDLVETLSNA